MRIASNQYHDTMGTALQSANTGVSRLMQQMASGDRLRVPSDDTIASVRLARLTQENAAIAQYRDNVGALTNRLQTNEVTLGAMRDDLMAARDLLVWAADGSNSAQDVQAMATSLESLRDSLYFSANTRNAEGCYLFSGTASDKPTVDVNDMLPVGQRYVAGQGINSGTQDVAVADGVTVTANAALAPLDVPAFLNQLDLAIEQFKNGGDAQGVARQSMVHLDHVLADVSAQISVQGGRQNVLQTLDANQSAVGLSNKQASLSMGSLDYADAAVKLNSYTLAVEATQKAYAKVSGLSLFNVF
jgi:flagellar hook-associated protein 3 FlgL